MRARSIILLALSCLSCLFIACAKEKPPPVRILMIGNSYTSGVVGTLQQMIADSGRHAVVEIIAPGGRTLVQHWAEAATQERIRNGDWDYVLLQDQSQTPGLGGEYSAGFHEASAAFCALIRESGATPVFFETWGRRDGDSLNPDLYPDYATMQDKLSAAYIAAAERNQATLAPVGSAWRRLREAEPELGQALYQADGSHPAAPGAALRAVVFMQVLFQLSPAELPRPGGIDAGSWAKLQAAATP